MAYTTTTQVRLLSNLTTSDIGDTTLTNLIAEATKFLNGEINVHVIRESVSSIDNFRENTIDGSNTDFYIKNWRNRFLADMNNDGSISSSDITVYVIDTDGTETTATVSSVDGTNGKFVLSSAPSSGQRLEITYDWCYRNPSTPDTRIGLACAFLTIALSYAKINWGRAPTLSFGNTRLMRHMEAFDKWYNLYQKMVHEINYEVGEISEA